MTYCTRIRHGLADETTPGGRSFRTCRQHARRRRAPHPHATGAQRQELLRLLDDRSGQRLVRGRGRTRRIGWLLQRMAGRSQLRPTAPLVAPPTQPTRAACPAEGATPEPSDTPTCSETSGTAEASTESPGNDEAVDGVASAKSSDTPTSPEATSTTTEASAAAEVEGEAEGDEDDGEGDLAEDEGFVAAGGNAGESGDGGTLVLPSRQEQAQAVRAARTATAALASLAVHRAAAATRTNRASRTNRKGRP